MTKRVTRPFIALDGEGYTDDNGDHHYYLLKSSSGEEISGESLTSVQCLNFLLELAKDHFKEKPHYVIYGGGYDVTKWLVDMPYELQVELKTEGQTRWEVPGGPFGTMQVFVMEYIPNKWFVLYGTNQDGFQQHIKIYDVVSFFQAPFIKALQSRNIEVDPIIVSGKASRSTFTYDDLEEVTEYCALELEYLVILMNTLREEFREAELNVIQWHGPGAVANAALKKYKIGEHHVQLSGDIENAANNAFYGGRFEHFYAGHYAHKVYVYDINSAYPHFIRNLPSLEGATWERVTKFDPNSFGLWYCTYEPDDAETDLESPRPLPWRSERNTVSFPRRVVGGWYHTPEAALATDVEFGYVLRLATDDKPFAFISEMYNKRKVWKAEGRGGERALKLAMNSIYGKLAQRVGWNEDTMEPPKWHQLFWAGYITSSTRAMLWSAIRQSPRDIIAVETDSVMSRVPLTMEVGSDLGQWEMEKTEWLTYIQSGIYFAGSDAGILTPGKTKMRGLDAGTLHYDEIREWLREGATEPFSVPAHRFIALANPQRERVGNWVDGTKTVTLAGGKRLHLPDMCSACGKGIPLSEGLHPLEVPHGDGHAESSTHTVPWKLGGVGHPENDLQAAPDAIMDYDKERRKVNR